MQVCTSLQTDNHASTPPLSFYRAMLCICGLAMGLCLCLSVTSRSSTKTAKQRITQTTPHDTPGTLVFWCQRSPQNSTGVTPYEGAECRWDGQNRRLLTNNGLYLENGTIQTHGFYYSRIGSRIRSIEWWHCPWLWVPPNCPKLPPFSAFCTTIHSLVTGEPRDFKFGTLTYHSKSYPADEKYSLKGTWSGLREQFLHCGL